MKSLKQKFSPTFRGVWVGLHHPAVLTQFILGTLAVIAGFLLRLSGEEWIAVIICIGMVITSEMLNTAAEWLCDLYSRERDERIRNIKDVAGGAVLCASFTALAVAIVILLRHI